MASWQAHLAAWIIRWRLKPRLAAARDMAELRRLLLPLPYRVPKDVRVAPGSAGGVPGEWVEAAGAGRRTMLYLHGGGYFACSAETHRAITVAWARLGYRVFAANYRLAPEHCFPTAVEDAVAAYRGLLNEGHPADQMVVAGDSAGGGLALALLVALREAGMPLPAAAALFSPWTDLAVTGESVQRNRRRCAMFEAAGLEKGASIYLKDANPRAPLASPLYADLTGLPPLVIHVGADELLRDDSVRLAERARAAGVVVQLKIWPVVPHVWQLAQGRIPEASRSLREAAAFLEEVLATRYAAGNAR